MSAAPNASAGKATAAPEQAPARAAAVAADVSGIGAVPFDGVSGAGLLGMLAAGDAGVTGRTLTALQRSGGNRAVSRMLQGPPGRPVTVQRIPPGWIPPDPAGDAAVREYHALPAGYAALSDPDKIKAIEGMFGQRSPSTIARAWSQLADEVGQARANPDLFARSVKVDDDILDHDAFDALKKQFQRDVEDQALSYLGQNRGLVHQEMERTGVAAEDRGGHADAAQDMGVQDVQKAAPAMERIVEAKRKARDTVIGTRMVEEKSASDYWESVERPARFDPEGPPRGYETIPDGPTWEHINQQWQRIVATEAALIRMHPTAAYLLGSGTKEIAGLKTADIKAARATISRALHDLVNKIEKAVPLVGDDLTFLDFPPIHQQLLTGTPSPSGTDWSKPMERLLVGEEIKDATFVNTLKTLGVATVAAAFFIFASIATAGGAAVLGAVLFAGGAVVGVGQAAASWDKYRDLAAAHAATLDPELALVSGEQVDAAAITAILDSVFAALDVFQALKGAYVGLKGGKLILEAGKAGVKGTARAALAGLPAASNKAEVITKAMAEIGPDEVRRLSGRSFDDLAELVGKETDLGKRLIGYGAKGTISESAKQLLEKLPEIAELGAREGEDVLRASMEAYGALGTLKRVKGGWGALKKTGAMKTAAGQAMESWRQGIVKEMEQFIAEESGKASKAIRTGTAAAASDLDVQIVGGTASELTTKAEGWLAGRLGTSVKDAKLLLDAEIFIDPLRAHLIDIMKDLEPAVRAEISQRMTGFERQMMYGARYKESLKTSKEAAEQVLQEAEGLGIKPFLGFEPLSAAAQKRLSGQIDGWMKELSQTADPTRKADLVEQISRAQASINASHPDAYIGGGVRVWVTGRDQDVATLAKALGIAEADLKAVSVAQRVTAALSEAKWLESAVKNLAMPGKSSLEELTKAVTNIGKHGARAAEQLGKAGAPNAERLAELMGKLKALKEMPADQVARTIKGGELGQLRGEIDGILVQLKAQTRTAVEGIGAEARTLNAPASDLAEFQRLLAWQHRYGVLVDGARDATAAHIKLIEIGLQEKLRASLPSSSPAEPNFQPAEGPPVNVQPLSIQRQLPAPTAGGAVAQRPGASVGGSVRMTIDWTREEASSGGPSRRR